MMQALASASVSTAYKGCLDRLFGCLLFTAYQPATKESIFLLLLQHDFALPLQIGAAEQYAQAGDVILSPEVTKVTAGHCTVDALESDNSRLVCMSQQEVVSNPNLCFTLPAHPHELAFMSRGFAAAVRLKPNQE